MQLVTCKLKWINCIFGCEMLVLRQNWWNLLNIGKDPGVSRFEFAIGFSVEASAEFYHFFFSLYWQKIAIIERNDDRHEIYPNKKPPTPPKKKGRKILILQEKSWKPAKYWQKIKKMQAWVRDGTFCWIFGLIRICSLSKFFLEKNQ